MGKQDPGVWKRQGVIWESPLRSSPPADKVQRGDSSSRDECWQPVLSAGGQPPIWVEKHEFPWQCSSPAWAHFPWGYWFHPSLLLAWWIGGVFMTSCEQKQAASFSLNLRPLLLSSSHLKHSQDRPSEPNPCCTDTPLCRRQGQLMLQIFGHICCNLLKQSIVCL